MSATFNEENVFVVVSARIQLKIHQTTALNLAGKTLSSGKYQAPGNETGNLEFLGLRNNLLSVDTVFIVLENIFKNIPATSSDV